MRYSIVILNTDQVQAPTFQRCPPPSIASHHSSCLFHSFTYTTHKYIYSIERAGVNRLLMSGCATMKLLPCLLLDSSWTKTVTLALTMVTRTLSVYFSVDDHVNTVAYLPAYLPSYLPTKLPTYRLTYSCMKTMYGWIIVHKLGSVKTQR